MIGAVLVVANTGMEFLRWRYLVRLIANGYPIKTSFLLFSLDSPLDSLRQPGWRTWREDSDTFFFAGDSSFGGQYHR